MEFQMEGAFVLKTMVQDVKATGHLISIKTMAESSNQMVTITKVNLLTGSWTVLGHIRLKMERTMKGTSRII
jgi:hypothetical protein